MEQKWLSPSPPTQHFSETPVFAAWGHQAKIKKQKTETNIEIF